MNMKHFTLHAFPYSVFVPGTPFSYTRIFSTRGRLLPLLLAALFVLPGRMSANSGFSSLASNPSIGELLNPDGTLNRYTGFSGSLDLNGFSVRLDPDKGVVAIPVKAPASPDAQGMMTSGWSPMGSGLVESGSYGECHTIVVSGTDVYVGGSFETAGGVPAENIAKWNGTSWSTLGGGLNGANCRVIVISGTDLYAGGGFYFQTASGVYAKNIAKWNGSVWSPLGTGITGACFSIAVSGTTVYAGGGFIAAGDVPANNIAKWDGTAWSALGSGLNGSCWSIAISGTDLYIAGSFSTAGGNPVNYVAKWNGSTWSALGTGMNGSCNVVVISGTDIYVGGAFTTPANNIAKWNGSAWSALGTGLNNGCRAIFLSGTDIYAGGAFTMAGGAPANSIAKWNGTSWSALDGGLNGIGCFAIGVSGTDVYAGGSFSMADGMIANSIAKWQPPVPVDTDGDGTPDPTDGCPTDPYKIAPGACGCNQKDEDTDADGTADCVDGCPNDQNKIAPGICGCGQKDYDSDNDGLYDCFDNCDHVANVPQTDIDCDGAGNACDLCPGGNDLVDNDLNGLPDCKYPPIYSKIIPAWKCGTNKVYVAHLSGGIHTTQCVTYSSLTTHLNHGDYLGPHNNAPCPVPSPNMDGGSDGLFPTELAAELELFPNPAGEEVNIFFERGDAPAVLTIYDQFGKAIWTETLEAGQMEITLHLDNRRLSNGVYLVCAESEGERRTQRLVIAR